MNFALMFALALGIDYALFIVMRFRTAYFGSAASARSTRSAVTMDTAGKAVLFSGDHRADLAVGGDARPQPGVPIDRARDHGLGRLRAGGDADAASGRARQARAARGQARPALGAQRRAPLAPFRALGPERLWRRPLLFGGVALVAAGRARRCRCCGLDTGMPSIKVVPEDDSSRRRLRADPGRLRRGRARRAPGRRAAAERRARRARPLAADAGIASVTARADRRRRHGAGPRRSPRSGPSERRRSGTRSTALRDDLPAGALVGGRPPRTTTSSGRWPRRRRS